MGAVGAGESCRGGKASKRKSMKRESGSEEKGLIETDFNPAGDIRVSYTWGVPGCGNLEGGGEKERRHGGVCVWGITSVNHFNDASPLH